MHALAGIHVDRHMGRHGEQQEESRASGRVSPPPSADRQMIDDQSGCGWVELVVHLPRVSVKWNEPLFLSTGLCLGVFRRPLCTASGFRHGRTAATLTRPQLAALLQTLDVGDASPAALAHPTGSRGAGRIMVHGRPGPGYVPSTIPHLLLRRRTTTYSVALRVWFRVHRPGAAWVLWVLLPLTFARVLLAFEKAMMVRQAASHRCEIHGRRGREGYFSGIGNWESS
ncbi:hypothetical protein B7494_g1087 [Chlorociboria aeruginascens]|nr:hypothetical protein B7494_g1087 [Chlorociboria aeruginascens]